MFESFFAFIVISRTITDDGRDCFSFSNTNCLVSTSFVSFLLGVGEICGVFCVDASFRPLVRWHGSYSEQLSMEGAAAMLFELENCCLAGSGCLSSSTHFVRFRNEYGL